MAIFTVHVPATRAGEAPAAEQIVLLRDGYSLAAMIFGPFWLAWNRAWIAAVGWTLLLALIAFAGVKLGVSQANSLAREPGLVRRARLRRRPSDRPGRWRAGAIPRARSS